MANAFIALVVPAGDGAGAWVDVSSMGPERTVSVDGGAFGGTIYIEGSNDAQASAAPAAVGPFVGPTFAPQVFLQAWNFLRVRRSGSGGVGSPTVTLAGPASIANVFAAMNVPAGDGVGTNTSVAGGGDVNTFNVVGAFTGQLLIRTSTDGVNFSPTLIFDSGGAVGQTVYGVLSAAHIRRRGVTGGAAPLVSVGSQATSGAAGGGFPGYGAAPPAIAAASAAGASALVSRADHTHQGALESGAYTPPGPLSASGMLSQVFAAGIATLAITAIPTSFPGFGGAPPSIASASAAGAAATASRSDHTHALDLVNYTPSLVAMQGTGLVTQTVFAAGVATLGLTAVPTSFPGFGGAPPAIASASAAGAAATASRSDHTHALDLVAYNPSIAGMQVSGVIQQTYGAPTATPSTLNVATFLIPYGQTTGTGLLKTQPGFGNLETAGFSQVFSLNTNTTPALASLSAQMNMLDETGSAAAGYTAATHVNAATFGSRYRFRRSRGTLAAPTTIVAQDAVGSTEWDGYNGTSYVRSAFFGAFIDDTGVIDATHTPTNIVMASNSGLSTTGAVPGSQITQMWTYTGDTFLGFTATPTNASTGFVWYRAMTGTGIPTAAPAVWTRIGVATASIATAMDSVNNRFWGNFGGGAGNWHFMQFNDYDPTATRIPFGGATTHTLVDSAAFTFATATGTLTVNKIVAQAGTALTLFADAGGAGVSGFSIAPAVAGAITFTGTLLPFSSATYDLASAAVQMRTIYTQELQVFGVNSIKFLGLAGGISSTVGNIAITTVGAFDVAINRNSQQRVVAGANGVVLYDAGGAVDALSTRSTGSVLVGRDSAMAVGAINGFPWMPYMNGQATGAVTAPGFTQAAPFCFDKSNGNFQIYNPVATAWLVFPAFNATAGAGAGVALISNLPAGFGVTAKWWNFTGPGGINCVIAYYTNP